MEETFDYAEVPSYFIHCFNASCPQAGQCLRRLAGSHVQPRLPVVEAVSPAVWPAGDGACAYFKPVERVRVAWGVRKALDKVPHADAKRLIAWLNRQFPRMTLWRIDHYKRPLTPDEQKRVVCAFRAYGIAEEDAFDYVTYSYKWQ